MLVELIIAGFGGQGVMLMGQLLTYAGMKAGREVSWIPSYGPEMRGGTANCTVVLADEEIASPLPTEPNVIVVMNRPSLDKFAEKVKTGGKLFVNSSLVDKEVQRQDIEVIEVPANELALDLGIEKVANMVMLGAVVAKLGVVDLETVIDSLSEVLPAHRHNLLELNKKALQQGRELII
ncbi:2-oxoacid:acceptor oxidoreductase family protein [Fuchsiella alkaliacetigena]|uniref:2-oxoacid:acceptor oxidoreductase family protein n=1 Tax=Fuchsiella alkaliacetigena TaxID=957042 RepID=UPI00200B5EED|nr:2-oxoacid:acceptor oxidoreductase family protein [Fuchsiella alkaliacetigena]MCK8824749.1 2-oxoacid:acceptor oxidoreductase family protein [Fuchsiella alkaliacetigena]